MTSDPRAELVVPGRIERFAIASGIERAAQYVRTMRERGGEVLVIDEGSDTSKLVRELASSNGIQVQRGWDPNLMLKPGEALATAQEDTHGRSELERFHRLTTLERFAQAAEKLIIVLNPRDYSRAVAGAIELGVKSIALPKHRTLVWKNEGLVTPWRRAADLFPLFRAARPGDYAQWRDAYFEQVTIYNETITSTDVREVMELPSAQSSARPKLKRAEKEVRRHRGLPGGRVPIQTFQCPPERLVETLQQLKITSPAASRDEEWVIGGRVIGQNRAIQVTRENERDRFSMQLIWTGRDPSPAELSRYESEVEGLLDQLEGAGS